MCVVAGVRGESDEHSEFWLLRAAGRAAATTGRSGAHLSAEA